jgi:hypothetical protein
VNRKDHGVDDGPPHGQSVFTLVLMGVGLGDERMCAPPPPHIPGHLSLDEIIFSEGLQGRVHV